MYTSKATFAWPEGLRIAHVVILELVQSLAKTQAAHTPTLKWI